MAIAIWTKGLWGSTGLSGPESGGCPQVEVNGSEGLLPKQSVRCLYQEESPVPPNPASGMFVLMIFKKPNWSQLFPAPTVQSKGAGLGIMILKSVLKEQRKF